MNDSGLKRVMIRWIAGEESGQGLVEYAFLLMLIAMAVSASVGKIAPALAERLEPVRNEF